MATKTSRQYRNGFIFLAALMLVTVITIYVYDRLGKNRARFVRYKEFGIDIPVNYDIHGIDVSRYQETIAWDLVKEMKVKEIQFGFCFIKATEGIGRVDPQYHRNWKKSKQAGIVRGAYHFFIASKDGKMQAQNFIEEVELEKGDLPPVLDVEQLNGSSATVLKKEVKKWLQTVEEHYGIRPVIYSNVDFYKNYLGSGFDDYPFWAAHYYQKDQPRISRDWSFWQHSEEGRVNGIVSKVDFNVFNGDSADFKQMLLK